MKTLYLRNVPDEVVKRLETLARREAMSVSAFAARELARTSLRADNAALLALLPRPEIEVTATDAVAAVEAGHRNR